MRQHQDGTVLSLRDFFFFSEVFELLNGNKHVYFHQVGWAKSWGQQSLEGAVYCCTCEKTITHTPKSSEQRAPDGNDKVDFLWGKPAEFYIETLTSKRGITWNKLDECVASQHSLLASSWRLKSNYFTMNEHHVQRKSLLHVYRNIPLKHLQVFPPFWFNRK